MSAKLHSGMSMNVGGTIDEGCRNEGMGTTGGVCGRLLGVLSVSSCLLGGRCLDHMGQD